MFKAIKTKRLLLSAPKLSEVPTLFSFLGDKGAMQQTHCASSLADCRRRIAVHEWRRRKDGFAPWTIRENNTQRIVGWGGLHDDPFDPGWGIELAYYFHPSVWGNGYATELSEAALKVADEQLNVEEVSAFAHPENEASNRVLKKSGFQFQRFIADMNRNLYARQRPGEEPLFQTTSFDQVLQSTPECVVQSDLTKHGPDRQIPYNL